MTYVNVKANTRTEHFVSFSKAFTYSPSVVVSAVTSAPEAVSISVKPNSIKTTGFTLVVKSIYDYTPLYIDWVALKRE